MELYRNEIKSRLDKEEKYRDFLFRRGYLLTDDDNIDLSIYPFYNNWTLETFGKFNIIVHKDQKVYSVSDDKKSLVIIGNFVNPFTKEYDGESILNSAFKKLYSRQGFQEYIDQLTGDFVICLIEGRSLKFCTDPTSMLFGCYAQIKEKLYISSHVQLIGDLTDLEKSQFTKKFEKYRYFYKYGFFFPGDHTQFDEVKRVLTNHWLIFNDNSVLFDRVYPLNELELCKNDKEYETLISNVVEILHNTMECVSKKWSNPAISLTGGMDSKTTLSVTNGLYDKYNCYSYISMDGDKRDAYAANKICSHLGLEHKIFNIPENNNEYEDINIIRAILLHNNGDYLVNENDLRKRCFFCRNFPYDVEVKSWVSEIARANYYKKFGLKKMPKKLSAKNMTSMYKIFLYQRSISNRVSKIFEEFIEKSNFNNFPKGYDASDMYLWEFRYSAWGGQVITSEHSFSNEIFIPYNNRKLLDLMLKSPKDKRISDDFHGDLIRYANSKIDETGINITNWNETKPRMVIEKVYFIINSKLPY